VSRLWWEGCPFRDAGPGKVSSGSDAWRANLNGFENEQQTKSTFWSAFLHNAGSFLTYQRPRCVGAIQIDDSAEVVVECDVDVQTTNDAILISKGFTL
jgi:hypothetical protein